MRLRVPSESQCLQCIPEAPLTIDELRDAWPVLTAEERFEGFLALDREAADDLLSRIAGP